MNYLNGTIYDPAGARGVELARQNSQGPGMPCMRHTRFCCRCQKDVASRGGRMNGPLFTCAGCLPKREPRQ